MITKIICLECETPLYKSAEGIKFCSPQCYHSYQKRNKKEHRGHEFVCQNCGKSFYSRKKDHKRIPKFCSRKCCGSYNGRNRSENANANRIKKVCKQCDKVFYVPKCFENQECCSKQCSYKYRTIYDTHESRYARDLGKVRRESLKKKISKTYLKALFIAQRGRCGYCDRPLSDYKAIDHINPVCRGGDNDNWNLLYTCKHCNSSKGGKSFIDYVIENEALGLIDKIDLIHARASVIESLLNTKI